MDIRRLRITAMAMLLVLTFGLCTGCGSGAQPLALGIAADDVASLDDFYGVTGRSSDVYEWYQAWQGEPAFDGIRATSAIDRGALPLLTWEPWQPGRGANQSAYALARIIAGDFDPYIIAFANQVRTWNRHLGLRFLHEIDAPFYPWGAGENGNTPAEAIQAWKHVREIFTDQGAMNVTWIWSANVHAPGSASYDALYPGDAWVDIVALDGYNGGTALPWGGWRSPDDIFGTSIRDLTALSQRPMAITEVGSVDQGGDKALWIQQLFTLVRDRGISLIVWFQYNKEADWRIASSPQAAASFREAAASIEPVTINKSLWTWQAKTP